MFSHVMVGTNNIERSKRFYDAVLAVLGASEPFRNQNATGQARLFYRHDGSSFCVSEPINGVPRRRCNSSMTPQWRMAELRLSSLPACAMEN
jgi:catechol 2,3-dioxygenase-like lactoylglutathione lyase family enzyme